MTMSGHSMNAQNAASKCRSGVSQAGFAHIHSTAASIDAVSRTSSVVLNAS